jgi:PAS domain S-box-containing protein
MVEANQAMQALRASEESYRVLTDNAVSGIAVHELVRDAAGLPVDYVFLSVNPAFERLTGLKSKDVLGHRATEILPGIEKTPFIKIYGQVAFSGEAVQFEQYSEPLMRHYNVSAYRVSENRFATSFEDITERKRAEQARESLEAQLRQSQKMESVGQLAGGVAHDFNNMLGVILGYAELALAKLGPADPMRECIQQIMDAGERSANLTRQLLAFARKQIIAPRVLDVNDTVASMLTMLQRLIGENLKLAWRPAANLWPVKMDPSQIDQLLANLAVNARDAIAGVGTITIATEKVEIDATYCTGHVDCVPRQYVMLTVNDDGCGMSPEVMEHIFEPFFTTKAVGEGTGLGLATVFGIVKQNGGFVNVYSEPGKGTTFKLYLPRAVAEDVSAAATPGVAETPNGTETVLLAEDEPALLELAQILLTELGYAVLVAASPAEAIRLTKEYQGEIHLLMTDVIMPEMSGRDLLKQVILRRPEIKCLFMSGYTADIIAQQGILDQDVHFLQKPFSLTSLAVKVREALVGG